MGWSFSSLKPATPLSSTFASTSHKAATRTPSLPSAAVAADVRAAPSAEADDGDVDGVARAFLGPGSFRDVKDAGGGGLGEEAAAVGHGEKGWAGWNALARHPLRGFFHLWQDPAAVLNSSCGCLRLLGLIAPVPVGADRARIGDGWERYVLRLPARANIVSEFSEGGFG